MLEGGGVMNEKDFLYFIAGQEKYLLRRAHPRVGDHAEDVLQETILAFLLPGEDGEPVYTKYPGFPNNMFIIELRKMFFHRMVNYIKKRNRGAWQDQAPLLDKDLDIQSVDGPDVAIEEYETMRDLPFWKLSTNQLQALDLFYGHGLQESEMESILGVLQPAISKWIARAIQILRERGKAGRRRTHEEEWRYRVQAGLLEELWKDRASVGTVLPALVYRLMVERGPAVATDHPDPDEDMSAHDPQNGGP